MSATDNNSQITSSSVHRDDTDTVTDRRSNVTDSKSDVTANMPASVTVSDETSQNSVNKKTDVIASHCAEPCDVDTAGSGHHVITSGVPRRGDDDVIFSDGPRHGDNDVITCGGPRHGEDDATDVEHALLTEAQESPR